MERYLGSSDELKRLSSTLEPGETRQLKSFHCPSLSLDLHSFVDSFGNVFTSIEGEKGCRHIVSTPWLFSHKLQCPHLIGVRGRQTSTQEATIGMLISRWNNFEAFEVSRIVSFPKEATDLMVERFCQQGESPGPGVPRPDPFGLEAAAKNSFELWHETARDMDQHLFMVRDFAESRYVGFLFCETNENEVRYYEDEEEEEDTFKGLDPDDDDFYSELKESQLVPPGLPENYVYPYVQTLRRIYAERLELGVVPENLSFEFNCRRELSPFEPYFLWDEDRNRPVDRRSILYAGRWEGFVSAVCYYLDAIAKKELAPDDGILLHVNTVCADGRYVQGRIGSVLMWMAQRELLRLHSLYSDPDDPKSARITLESVPSAVGFYRKMGFSSVNGMHASHAALTDMTTGDLSIRPLEISLPFVPPRG